MNEYRRVLSVAALLLTGGLAGAQNSAAAEECWAEFYDKTNFEGARLRLNGPIELANLKNVEGADWSNRIDSLTVGPKAHVLAFRHENFQDPPKTQVYHGEALKAWGESPQSYSTDEIGFAPGQREHHLGEWDFHQNINSLKIKCLP